MPPPAVNTKFVLLPRSKDPAPMYHVVDFFNMAGVELDDDKVSRAAVLVPFRLKPVRNSFVVPPTKYTLPTAVLVMLLKVFDPETVSPPVPPWFRVIGYA